MRDGVALAAEVASRGQYRFTAEEFRRMPEAEMPPGHARVELIEGVVVPMAPTLPDHYSVIYLLEGRLREALEPRLKVRSHAPVQLGQYTQAAPDISVITPRQDGYRYRLPGADDILLLVEVAESALSCNRHDKVPLYALHGIREFWLIGIAERQALVLRDPVDGAFRSERAICFGGFLEPLVAPGLRIPFEEFL
ncbi:Uma2 family endonuclease [Pseudoroseomonas cervicalis]|uniref:Putative restriction endonuclease domain-containing protein n=1 Tax=Pseudoroseomonas cervicalis ATCC 49957 TaxID=525371 RepID=D5RUG4_9PROT|nr:Uma2 family endonuclease [Pseudoroseomonas cervicalis]EFH09055.1 hypothetical protein HMPREF0731_4726 [Pseudoroseomonas cervicalis ATCC 49957]